MRTLAALLLCLIPVRAAEIELRYTALERILAAQMFTQDGRHYVRGSKASRCQFAYLENPRIDNDGGKLRVRARFSGRSAVDVLGGCVGLGDSFDLAIAATPYPREASIVLREVNVTSAKDSYYIRRVRAALAQSIARDFKIELHDQAKKLFEQSGAVYHQDLASFHLSEIRLTPEAMVLVIEFRVVVQ
jgi:hypothetical protein